LLRGYRHLTIEEVSAIFDTGRLGNSAAAVAEFRQTKDPGTEDERKDKETVSHVENKEISV
jgi:hypothetical protein